MLNDPTSEILHLNTTPPQNRFMIQSDNLVELSIPNPLHSRLINPALEGFTGDLVCKVNTMKEKGQVVMMVAGVFDVLHPNHVAYLTNTKLAAIHAHLTINGYPISPDILVEELLSDKYKMIVTVDGDKQVSVNKGFNPSKGGVRKPLQSWSVRARNVAQIAIPCPDDDRHMVSIPNLVTIHDHLEFPDPENPHSSDIAMGKAIKPNFWLTFGEEGNITHEKAIALGLPETYIIQTPVHNFEINPFTGRPYSTSDLIKSIKES